MLKSATLDEVIPQIVTMLDGKTDDDGEVNLSTVKSAITYPVYFRGDQVSLMKLCHLAATRNGTMDRPLAGVCLKGDTDPFVKAVRELLYAELRNRGRSVWVDAVKRVNLSKAKQEVEDKYGDI
jgi:hypothetical protein